MAVFALLIIVAMIVIGIGMARSRRRANERVRNARRSPEFQHTVDTLCSQLGLVLGERDLSGTIEGMPIRIPFRFAANGLWFQPARVTAAVSPVLSLDKASQGETLTWLVGSGDTTVGDETFDRAFKVGGPSAEALATLSAEARQSLHFLVERVFLRKGDLCLSPGPGGFSTDDLRALVRAAQALEASATTTGGLAARVLSDPDGNVRRNAWRYLSSRADGPEVAQAAQLVMTLPDWIRPHPALIWAAARRLGREGRQQFQEVLLDPLASFEFRKAGLDAWLKDEPAEPLLRALLLDPAPRMCGLALQYLIDGGYHVSHDDLALVYGRGGHDSAIRALQRLHWSQEESEEALLRWPTDGSREALLAVCRHLGEIGGSASYHFLARLRETSQVPDVVEAATQAQARITQRGEMAAGGLSLAEGAIDAAGGLTVAAEASGQLAVTDSLGRETVDTQIDDVEAVVGTPTQRG